MTVSVADEASKDSEDCLLLVTVSDTSLEVLWVSTVKVWWKVGEDVLVVEPAKVMNDEDSDFSPVDVSDSERVTNDTVD
jgi:hypothetical protein